MTAARVPEPGADFPQWLVPPPGGFVAEDLDRLPNLPPHTELIDGSLIPVSPQARFHALVIELLVFGLRAVAPRTMKVRREMTVTIGRHQRPEPDLIVVHASADRDLNQTTYQTADVVLAVEVVSPDSVARDKERKPQLYAKAGFPHFWLVENSGGRPVVYVYELDPIGQKYVLTGIFHDKLRLTAPFAIELDLSEIDEM